MAPDPSRLAPGRRPARAGGRGRGDRQLRAKGIVTRKELLEAGVTDGAIVQHRLSGALIDEYRGVYRVGHRGIPITSVPLTLLDFIPLLAQFELAGTCHEAGVRYGTTPRMVEEVLARRPSTPGAAKLRAILRGEEKVSPSKLERRFLSGAICGSGIERPSR